MDDSYSIKAEKGVLNKSMVGTVVFVIAEVLCAIYTHSMAMLMDAAYDLSDLLMAIPFFILIPQLYKPVTEKRPYGYSQVESLFILIKYSVLLLLEAFLVKESIVVIMEGGNHVHSTFIAVFEIFVSLGCITMFFYLSKLSKEIMSPALKAELFLWKLSAISTMGVGVGFLVNAIIGNTGLSWICPYVDPGIAILGAVLLAKEPISMIVESIRNLILFAPDEETVKGITDISTRICTEYACKVTFVDVIKTGRTYWIDVYFEVNDEVLRIDSLKALDMELENELENAYEDIWLELIPDVEEFRGVSPVKKPFVRQDKISYMEGRQKTRKK